jgi:hypothetical protein
MPADTLMIFSTWIISTIMCVFLWSRNKTWDRSAAMALLFVAMIKLTEDLFLALGDGAFLARLIYIFIWCIPVFMCTTLYFTSDFFGHHVLIPHSRNMHDYILFGSAILCLIGLGIFLYYVIRVCWPTRANKQYTFWLEESGTHNVVTWHRELSSTKYKNIRFIGSNKEYLVYILLYVIFFTGIGIRYGPDLKWFFGILLTGGLLWAGANKNPESGTRLTCWALLGGAAIMVSYYSWQLKGSRLIING